MDLELKGKLEISRSTRIEFFIRKINLAASFFTQSTFKICITTLTLIPPGKNFTQSTYLKGGGGESLYQYLCVFQVSSYSTGISVTLNILLVLL